MTLRPIALSLIAASLLTSAPAQAQVSGTAVPTVLGAQASVAAFYKQYTLQPLWFKGGVPSPAVADLIRILRRAPFDGFPEGPQLASQVEAAALSAASGNSASVSAAERTTSAAWVAYVQAIKRPTPGMIYAYPVLAPQGSRTDQILLTAAGAPSLQVHVNNVSNVNPI